MANSQYFLGTESFGEGQFDWLTDTLALAMFTSAYTPNYTTDQFYSTPVASSGIVGTKISLTSVTAALGTLSAANTVFPSVTSGSTVTQCVLFKDTGTTTTSRLIANINTASGLPLTTDGNNVTVAWAGGQVLTLFESLAEKTRDKSALQRMKEIIKQIRDAMRGRNWGQSDGGLYIPEPAFFKG